MPRTPSSRSGDRRRAWRVAAAVTLALGFADLAHGGVTLAPVLLAVGYCVLVPIALIR